MRANSLERRKEHTPVDVQFSVVGQVVVNDEGHLRDIQAPSPDICRNEHSAAQRKVRKVRAEWSLAVLSSLAKGPEQSHHPQVTGNLLQLLKTWVQPLQENMTFA